VILLPWGTPLLAQAAMGLGLYVSGIAESEERVTAAVRHAVIVGALAGVALGALFGQQSHDDGRRYDKVENEPLRRRPFLVHAQPPGWQGS
jgi:hypothetical protein